MRKIIYIILSFTILIIPKNSNGQNNAAVTGAVAAVSLLSLAATVDNLIESLELDASEYVLKNFPNVREFSLKYNNSFTGTGKLSDESLTYFYTFDLTLGQVNSPQSERLLLVYVAFPGFMNEQGIKETYIRWEVFNQRKWNQLYEAYANLAFGKQIIRNGMCPKLNRQRRPDGYDVKDSSHHLIRTLNGSDFYIADTYETYKLSDLDLFSKGLEYSDPSGMKPPYLVLPFAKIDGDTYFQQSFNEDLTIVYNEKSLGFFYTDIERLFQIKHSILSDINRFLNYRPAVYRGL